MTLLQQFHNICYEMRAYGRDLEFQPCTLFDKFPVGPKRKRDRERIKKEKKKDKQASCSRAPDLIKLSCVCKYCYRGSLLFFPFFPPPPSLSLLSWFGLCREEEEEKGARQTFSSLAS